ncbi:MAG: hypothetical protein DHS20C15_17310 [Planctomycetota bacterium]|nr:MAG: hypothetical protein DHS20C15_17310 [Planctomycetota bacterium]
MVIAMVALLFAGGVAMAGDSVNRSPGGDGPVHGPAGQWGGATAGGAGQECFNDFLSNVAGCHTLYCSTYFWLVELCDTTALKICKFNAQSVFNACMASSP